MTDKTRVMTKEDFREQEELIWEDTRLNFELKRWKMQKLLEIYKEINGHYPYQRSENANS